MTTRFWCNNRHKVRECGERRAPGKHTRCNQCLKESRERMYQARKARGRVPTRTQREALLALDRAGRISTRGFRYQTVDSLQRRGWGRLLHPRVLGITAAGRAALGAACKAR